VTGQKNCCLISPVVVADKVAHLCLSYQIKANGGLRAIILVVTLRKLLGKALTDANMMMAQWIYEAVGQLGVGIPNATNIIAAGTQRFVDEMAPGQAVVLLDEVNAFNSKRRAVTKMMINKYFPSMSVFWHDYCNDDTKLFYKEGNMVHEILLREGNSQGCTVTPMIYSAADAILVKSHQGTACKASLLDDKTVMGTVEETIIFVNHIVSEGPKHGCKLSIRKCVVLRWGKQRTS